MFYVYLWLKSTHTWLVGRFDIDMMHNLHQNTESLHQCIHSKLDSCWTDFMRAAYCLLCLHLSTSQLQSHAQIHRTYAPLNFLICIVSQECEWCLLLRMWMNSFDLWGKFCLYNNITILNLNIDIITDVPRKFNYRHWIIQDC